MPSYVSGAAITLVAWAVISLQFVGLGLLLMRPIGVSNRVFLAFWLGFALTLAYLQVLSLFLPISPAELLPLLGVGLAGWVANGRPIVARVHGAWRGRGRWTLLLALFVWGAVYAQVPIANYDAGFYHLAAIRWASTFPVVPGLGNLDRVLGTNSSWFLLIAALRAGELPGFHVAMGLLVAVLLLQLVSVARLPVGNHGATSTRPSAYLAALLVLPTLVLGGQAGFSSTDYDAQNYLLAIVLAMLVLDLLDGQARTRREVSLTVLAVALLAFTGITIKLSIGVFSLACLAIAIAVAVRSARPGAAALASYLGLSAAIALLVLGPWLARNVVLTGYPLYPDPTAGIPFDWSMPRETVRDYRDVVYDFARVHGPGFTGASQSFGWLAGSWLALSWRDLIAPMLIAVLTPLGMLGFSRQAALRVGRRWLVLVPVWLALVFWFVTAPDPRFAGSLFWLAAAAPVAFWLPAAPRLAQTALLVGFLAGVEMPNASHLMHLIQVPAMVATGQFADIPDVPEEQFWVFTTRSDLQVYVPVDGDQVWDAPLPATPYPNPDLRLRCPHSLACGFAVS